MGNPVQHGERAHALLSPSGSSRWMKCPPSARLEEELSVGKKAETSVFAEEGTLAHEMSEVMLRNLLGIYSDREHAAEIKKIKAHKLFTSEMPEQVSKYVDYVWGEYAASESDPNGTGAELFIEQKTDLREWVPESFGSCDSVIIADGKMKVIDLKYGKGLQVEAEENSQLMLYGLGALHLNELSYDIDQVELTIHQPRLNHVSTWVISAEALREWGTDVVAKKAKLAFAGKGKFCSGDHCRWCKAAPVCRELSKKNLEVAKHDFAKPAILTDEELMAVYDQLDRIAAWTKSVKGYVLSEAINGKKWDGLKLVEGKSNRKWINEDEAQVTLINEGCTSEEITNVKMKGLGDIEKLLKKKKKLSVIKDLVVKPAGAPTLVLESDKRPEYSTDAQVREDFS